MDAPSNPSPAKRLRILVLWGAAHFESFFTRTYLEHPGYDFEVVSGDRTTTRSPHAASWARLLDLRRRLKKGEFDLVLSGSIQNSAWPLNKRLATRLAQAFRFFTYKHRKLDTYWTPWLMAGLEDRVPMAVTDYLDTVFVLPRDYPLLKACTLYFKVNLYYWPRRSLMPLENMLGARRVTPLAPKLRAMSHGTVVARAPATARPMSERDIDICLTGSIRPSKSVGDIDPFPELSFNPIRKDIFERTQKLGERYKVFCIDGTVPYAEYRELLQRSKMMVCTESFGCETSRMFDAAASGAIPLVNWPYAQHFRQYEPDKHAIYFSLIGNDFERVVAESLASPEKLDRISRETRAFTLAEKDCQQMADYVIAETLAEFEKRKLKWKD
jgi:hypothetical protein